MRKIPLRLKDFLVNGERGERKLVGEGIGVAPFAAHPEDDRTLCVGYTDGSIYATADGGDTWSRLKVAESKLYGLRLLAAAS